LRLEQYHFNSDKIPSTTPTQYQQNANKTGVMLKNNKVIHSHSSISSIYDTSLGGTLFSRSEFNKITASKSITGKTSSALSPNGNHFVSSWAEYDGSTWKVKIIKRAQNTVTNLSFSTCVSSSASPPETKVTINNGGEATVAFTTIGDAASAIPDKLYALSFKGSEWYFWDETSNSTESLSNTSLEAIDSSDEPIVFDLVDEDPSSSSSKKRIVYSKKYLLHLIESLKTVSLTQASTAGRHLMIFQTQRFHQLNQFCSHLLKLKTYQTHSALPGFIRVVDTI
jgi:hypothetical protein